MASENYEAKHKELSSDYVALTHLNNQLCRPDHEIRKLLVEWHYEIVRLRRYVAELEAK